MSESGADKSSSVGAEMVEMSYELDETSVAFTVSEDLYPLDAIYGAAYLFVDRCYLFLSRPVVPEVKVRLRAKDPSKTDLEALAGEFANELLNQVVRHRVTESTSNIRDYYMARAFFTDTGRASIDALLAELDAEELDEDPLEISVPWDDAKPDDNTDEPGAEASGG